MASSRHILFSFALACMASFAFTQEIPARLAAKIASDYYSMPTKLTTVQKIPTWKFHKVKLNKQSLIAYIIQREDPDYCGSGGCGMFIYAEVNGNYRCLYGGDEFYCEFMPLKSITNNLYDLGCKNVQVNGSFYFHTLWFDGKQYQSAKNGANHT